ncbi:MAG: hypothetical protein HYT79_02765 [Elusimicrobia bacterium]|nr:hypothetical protein [Elusimicrobiota bacterium]
MKKVNVHVRLLGVVAMLLAALWVIPPIVHRIKGLCPVRPNGIGQAEAVPAYARKYGISCSQCHSAFPLLNDYGREFKNNGYVRERAKEAGAKIEASDMFLPSTFPWGGLVKARPLDRQKSGGKPRQAQNRALHEIELFVADGSIAKGFSYFMEIEAEDDHGTGFEPEFGDLSVGYHPSPYLNVVAGYGDFLHRMDSYQTLAHSGFTRRASDARELLMLNQQFLSLGGELSKEGLGALGYAAALGGGMGAATAGTTAQEGYGPPNYNFRLVADTLKGIAVGGFLRTGKEDLTSKNLSGVGINKMSDSAVDVLVELMGLGVRGALVNTKNETIATSALNSKNTGNYLEAFYTVKKDERPWIVPLARFDRTKNKITNNTKDHLVANLSYYPMENVRGLLEYYDELADKTAGIKGTKDTRWTMQFEVGF